MSQGLPPQATRPVLVHAEMTLTLGAIHEQTATERCIPDLPPLGHRLGGVSETGSQVSVAGVSRHVLAAIVFAPRKQTGEKGRFHAPASWVSKRMSHMLLERMDRCS